MSIIDFAIRGYLEWPLWGIVLYMFGTTHVTIASVTIFLHRYQAHRALDLHWLPEHFFRFWLWVGTNMVTTEWVSTHRKHHAKCETEDDPHSPQVYGIRKVFWTGAELYREAINPETMEKYGYGTPDDWIERNLYTRHPKVGIALMLIVDLFFFGAIGFTVWAVQMAWIPVMAAGVINGYGHYKGYRNFSSPDAATNISPWGILIGGEELHNNHHTYPTSAKLSVKWWEFDIGWGYIRFLERIGLAKVKEGHLPPKIEVIPEPNSPAATAQVVVALRFEVLARLDDLAEWSLTPNREAQLRKLRAEFVSLWEDRSLTIETRTEKFRHWCDHVSDTGITSLLLMIDNFPYWRVVRR